MIYKPIALTLDVVRLSWVSTVGLSITTLPFSAKTPTYSDRSDG